MKNRSMITSVEGNRRIAQNAIRLVGGDCIKESDDDIPDKDYSINSEAHDILYQIADEYSILSKLFKQLGEELNQKR